MVIKRILHVMTEKHITKKELSEAIGFGINQLKRWEDKGEAPDVYTLMSIAKYLNVSINFLIGEKEPNRTSTDQEMLDRITECFDLCDGPRKATLCVKAEELAKETQNQVKQTS